MFVTKKSTVMIAAFLAVLVIVPSTFPVIAEEDLRIKEVKAKGIALVDIGEERIKIPVRITLYCEVTKRYQWIKSFKVDSGVVELDDVTHEITDGTGLILQRVHAGFLNASGTSNQAEPIKLKLKFRYFWIWGRVYVARLKGVLEINGIKHLLILRAVKVP